MRILLTIALLSAVGLAAGVSANASGVPIAYALSKPSNVSINICDAHGQVVRELMHAISRPAGASTDTWDGLGDDSMPVPLGSYTWKLLATPDLKAQYLLSLGGSYSNAADSWSGRAPGTHGGPSAVAVDNTGIYCATYGTIRLTTPTRLFHGIRLEWLQPGTGIWQLVPASQLAPD